MPSVLLNILRTWWRTWRLNMKSPSFHSWWLEPSTPRPSHRSRRKTKLVMMTVKTLSRLSYSKTQTVTLWAGGEAGKTNILILYCWWGRNVIICFNVCKHLVFCRKYLCVPATSTQAERMFSALGLLLTKRRLAMTGDNVNARLFLRDYLEIICNIFCW